MNYRRSQEDKSNFNWFKNDKTKNTLVKLSVSNGQIRGVSSISIDFEYPITTIVGENGSGKSTLLALACCAFHNNSAYFPQNRIRLNVKKPRNYYTYGDFFTFAPDEQGISGIEIEAHYLSKEGVKCDTRHKKPSGKWNDYNSRPKRAVAYLGINRIVPPSESNPHRHYSRNFIEMPLEKERIEQLKKSMSFILGREYLDIELRTYNAYRLFEARRNNLTYTGFNMGAGENAVLGLLLEIISAGPGALIVVDEIELGLHVQAQKRLIDELKKLCYKYKIQIICSTHSKEILENIPPEGRVFLKRHDEVIDVIPRISPEYAFGKLSGKNSNEISVFVEDDVGQAFLCNVLPQSIRERIRIIPVGSDQAVLKHMAVHYREGDNSFIAFLDGDKRSQKESALRQILRFLEDRLRSDDNQDSFNDMMSKQLNYLPGNEWPEKELLNNVLLHDDLSSLENNWGCPSDEINSAFEHALTAEKHSEFYQIAEYMSLSLEQIRVDTIRFYKSCHEQDISIIINLIRNMLTSN